MKWVVREVGSKNILKTFELTQFDSMLQYTYECYALGINNFYNKENVSN